MGLLTETLRRAHASEGIGRLGRSCWSRISRVLALGRCLLRLLRLILISLWHVVPVIWSSSSKLRLTSLIRLATTVGLRPASVLGLLLSIALAWRLLVLGVVVALSATSIPLLVTLVAAILLIGVAALSATIARRLTIAFVVVVVAALLLLATSAGAGAAAATASIASATLALLLLLASLATIVVPLVVTLLGFSLSLHWMMLLIFGIRVSRSASLLLKFGFCLIILISEKVSLL